MRPSTASSHALNLTCAWLLVASSLFGLIWMTLQTAGIIALENANAEQWLTDNGFPPIGLFAWLLDHALGLSVIALLSCLPCLTVAIGMLQRRNWARIGFITLMLIGAVLNLGCYPLANQLLTDLVVASGASIDDPALQDLRLTVLFSLGIPLVGTSAVHVLMAVLYNRADMRTFYQR